MINDKRVFADGGAGNADCRVIHDLFAKMLLLHFVHIILRNSTSSPLVVHLWKSFQVDYTVFSMSTLLDPKVVVLFL